MLAFVCSLCMGFALPTLLGIAGAIALFFVLRALLRALADIDPNFASVYSNAQQYRQGSWLAKPQRAHLWRSQ